MAFQELYPQVPAFNHLQPVGTWRERFALRNALVLIQASLDRPNAVQTDPTKNYGVIPRSGKQKQA